MLFTIKVKIAINVDTTRARALFFARQIFLYYKYKDRPLAGSRKITQNWVIFFFSRCRVNFFNFFRFLQKNFFILQPPKNFL